MRIAALCGLAALGCGPAIATELSVYNWSDYIAPGVIETFEAETGVLVRYDTYAVSETAEARLLAGQSGYDVVVVTSEYLRRLVAAGAVAPLDPGKLTNVGHLDPGVMARLEAIDPGGRHAAPYLWGTTGIAFDASQIAARAPDAPTDSWAMVFDPSWVSRFADCGVGVVDEPEEVVAAALLWLGRDPMSEAPEDIDAALDAIEAVSPYVRRFDSEQVGDLAEGRLCLTVSWSADALAAAEEAAAGIDLRYVVPREGAHLWVDMLVIPADAPNVEDAHRFIDFMLRPEIAALNTNTQLAPNANAGATPLVAPEIRDNPLVYPPAEVLERLYGLAGRDLAAKRAIARQWTAIKLGIARPP